MQSADHNKIIRFPDVARVGRGINLFDISRCSRDKNGGYYSCHYLSGDSFGWSSIQNIDFERQFPFFPYDSVLYLKSIEDGEKEKHTQVDEITIDIKALSQISKKLSKMNKKMEKMQTEISNLSRINREMSGKIDALRNLVG